MQAQAPRTLADKAKVDVTGSSKTSNNTPPPANSLAAKAGLVQKYNEEHGVDVDETTGTARKKYKK